MVDLFFAV
jgi:Na+-driven multidrug efflux pump